MALPPELSLDEVIVRIKQAYQNKNNNVGRISHVVLREGPQAYKVATLMEILDPVEARVHHHSLKIDHFNRFAKKGWTAKAEKSIRLDGKDPDEINRLYGFLHTYSTGAIQAETSSKLHVVRTPEYSKLTDLLKALPTLSSTDKMDLLRTLIEDIGESGSRAGDYVNALRESDVNVLRHIASASRYFSYRKALAKLEDLVDGGDKTSEAAFQVHLEENSWMFGSEYSELLTRRKWARDENLDYMLRRTSDGYLEIVEIKKAVQQDLFNYDSSHSCYYPSAGLSKVVGQVMNYIEQIEGSRDRIRAVDKEDVLNIRAKIIMGRNGNDQQLAALRNYNDQLHSIQILTYDQLIAISARVLRLFSEAFEHEETEPDDLPF